MNSFHDPAPGTDFWAALGVGDPTDETDEHPPTTDGGRPPAEQADWASMFSDTEVPVEPSPARSAEPAPPEPPSPASERPAPAKPPQPKEPESAADKLVHSDKRRTAKPAARPPAAVPAADRTWINAERLARSLRSRIVVNPTDVTGSASRTIWLEPLTRLAQGDRVLAARAYDVLSGWHLLGELWRDERVDEIHVRGTQVTVCGALTIRQVPGFLTLARARRALELIAEAQDDAGAVVTHIGGSVVVSRRHRTVPDTSALVNTGVITKQQVSTVGQALDRLRPVTVTGPAAPVIMRALSSLVPAGSRIFEGAFAVVPAGCVVTTSPLDADYVIGVRPSAEAEEMAAAGQLGALLANPRTQLPEALRLHVSGRSAAPGKVTEA